MSYAVRPMCMGDVPQVNEIDRECFPTQWPTISFRRELLSNRLSRYLVVLEESNNPSEPVEQLDQSGSGSASRFSERLRRFFPTDNTSRSTTKQRILGVVGFWIMADEAHISTIGVRSVYRRQGLGELLLISTIELAQTLNAHVITLEVRASNSVAQALYEKYGFAKAGVRRGYYSDREDAVIMTTDAITSAPFQSQFQRLKESHAQTWRLADCHST
ncbi:MAG: ribosomal protein S18-alanine N-acetyltransferase [Dehalococcoidia bacterium]